MQLPPDAPSPRLCIIEKSSVDQEYGYNLHAEKGKDQFVGTVDKGSVADKAGLRMGDRIFAVNGVSIQGESHRKVVERIKQDPLRCELLVLEEAGVEWYKEHNISISPTLPNIITISKDHPLKNNNVGESSGSPPPNTWYAPSQNSKDPVFVAPPPPDTNTSSSTMNSSLRPKPTLARLEKKSVTDEFGFNLHAEKNKGHFIGAVDANGIGDRAGLKMGQRIVGVNHVLVNPSTPHKEVIGLIKKNPLTTVLLVASEEVDNWYKQHNESYSFEVVEEGSKSRNASVTGHTHESRRGSSSSVLAIPSITRSRAPTAEDIASAVVSQIRVPDEIVETRPLSAVPEEEDRSTSHLDYRSPSPTPASNSDDLMSQVFGALDSKLATELSTEVEYKSMDHFVSHHYEEPPMIEEYHHTRKVSSPQPEERHEIGHLYAVPPVEEPIQYSNHSNDLDLNHILAHVPVHDSSVLHHERSVDVQSSPEETPIMTPEPTFRSTVHHESSIGNGAMKMNNSYSHEAPLDIFQLSAKEARERLRQNKRRDLRGMEMSLEEKHRIVSSM